MLESQGLRRSWVEENGRHWGIQREIGREPEITLCEGTQNCILSSNPTLECFACLLSSLPPILPSDGIK